MSQHISNHQNPLTRTLDTFLTYSVMGLVIVLPLGLLITGFINAILPTGYKFLPVYIPGFMYCGPSCKLGIGVQWVFTNWYVPLALLMGLYGILRGLIDSITPNDSLSNTLLVTILRLFGFSLIYHIASWAPLLNDLLHPLYLAVRYCLHTAADWSDAFIDWLRFTFFGTGDNFWEGLNIALAFLGMALVFLLQWGLLVLFICLAPLVLVALNRRRPAA